MGQPNFYRLPILRGLLLQLEQAGNNPLFCYRGKWRCRLCNYHDKLLVSIYQEAERKSNAGGTPRHQVVIWLIFFISFSFGSQYRSTRTGIIYNNEMDDFSIPGEKNSYGVEPSESNMIQPGKRPQSSTAPTIFLDQDGEARLVIGASGGTRITTAISLVSSD